MPNQVKICMKYFWPTWKMPNQVRMLAYRCMQALLLDWAFLDFGSFCQLSWWHLKNAQSSENACIHLYASILTWLGIFQFFGDFGIFLKSILYWLGIFGIDPFQEIWICPINGKCLLQLFLQKSILYWLGHFWYWHISRNWNLPNQYIMLAASILTWLGNFKFAIGGNRRQ